MLWATVLAPLQPINVTHKHVYQCQIDELKTITTMHFLLHFLSISTHERRTVIKYVVAFHSIHLHYQLLANCVFAYCWDCMGVCLCVWVPLSICLAVWFCSLSILTAIKTNNIHISLYINTTTNTTLCSTRSCLASGRPRFRKVL